MTQQFNNIPQKIGVLGDWHGDTEYATRILRDVLAYSVDLFIHAGDFGYWIMDENDTKSESFRYIDELEEVLADLGKELWWVDGNHEYFPGFDRFLRLPDGRWQVSPHIFYLPRGYRWQWGETTWMALGGAVSVDRFWRKAWVDWFAQEEISVKDAKKACEPGAVDVMVTHDAPPNHVLSDFLKRNGGENFYPPADIEASKQHQKLLAGIVDEVKPKHLFHGHYHYRYDGIYMLPDGETTEIHGLNCNQSNYWMTDENHVIVNHKGEII